MSPQIAVWPGDVPYTLERTWSLGSGDSVEVGAVRTTLHVGAHADAPAHYLAGGATIDTVDLDPYLGPCEVIAVRVGRGARVVPADLPTVPATPRVLIRTDSYLDPDRFDRDFASLSPELVEHLHALGVVLIGIDTPSVDPVDSRALESHHALLRRGMRNLEGLVLAHVEPGAYVLVALPLRLVGADASPVRAVLIGGG